MAYLNESLSRSLGTFIGIFLRVLLLILILSHLASVPRRESIHCIGFKLFFLCGVVGFATHLAKWLESSRFLSFRLFVLLVLLLVAFCCLG